MAVALVGALMGAPGCAAEDEPIGDLLLRGVGGWCDNGCGRFELRRDGDRLQLFEDDDASYGTWTIAGETEYAEAAAEAAENPQRDSGWSCASVDGRDREVTLTHDGTTWTAQYCSSREPPTHLMRMDALLDATIDALQECAADEWTEPDC